MGHRLGVWLVASVGGSQQQGSGLTAAESDRQRMSRPDPCSHRAGRGVGAGLDEQLLGRKALMGGWGEAH